MLILQLYSSSPCEPHRCLVSSTPTLLTSQCPISTPRWEGQLLRFFTKGPALSNPSSIPEVWETRSSWSAQGKALEKVPRSQGMGTGCLGWVWWGWSSPGPAGSSSCLRSQEVLLLDSFHSLGISQSFSFACRLEAGGWPPSKYCVNCKEKLFKKPPNQLICRNAIIEEWGKAEDAMANNYLLFPHSLPPRDFKSASQIPTRPLSRYTRIQPRGAGAPVLPTVTVTARPPASPLRSTAPTHKLTQPPQLPLLQKGFSPSFASPQFLKSNYSTTLSAGVSVE